MDSTAQKNDSSPVSSFESPSPVAPVKRALVLRLLRWFCLGIGILLISACAVSAGILFYLRSESGEQWLTSFANSKLEGMANGLSVKIESIQGPVPSALTIHGIRAYDNQGEWFSAEQARLKIAWSRLFDDFCIAELSLKHPEVLRTPVLAPSETPQEQEEPSKGDSLPDLLQSQRELFKNWPGWLPGFIIEKIEIAGLKLHEPVAGFPFMATLTADASASAKGIHAHLHAQRDDMKVRPFSVLLDIDPDWQIKARIDGSDMGIAAKLPDLPLQDAALAFRADAAGTIEKFILDISTEILQRSAKQPVSENMAQLASLSAGAAVTLSSSSVEADVDAILKTGSSASPLWQLAGQKNGLAEVKFSGHAAVSDSVDFNGETSLKFSDMQWGSELVGQLLGSAPSITFSMGAKKDSNGGISAQLANAVVHAQKVNADARGSINLAPDFNLKNPESNINFNANLELSEITIPSEHFAVDAAIAAGVKGSFNALDVTAEAKSNRLQAGTASLKDTAIKFLLPCADLPRLLADLPLLLNQMQSSSPSSDSSSERLVSHDPLLTGKCSLASSVNGQKVSFDSGWTVKDTGNAITFSLDNMTLAADKTDLHGKLTAEMPFQPAVPETGSIAYHMGFAMPILRGELDASVSHWKTLSDITGMKISGEPLTARIQLTHDHAQHISFKSNLAQLSIRNGSADLVGLKGFSADFNADDLWGWPNLTLKTSLGSFAAAGMQGSGAALAVNAGTRGPFFRQ